MNGGGLSSCGGHIQPRETCVRLDTGFRPSKHGFGFANTWRDVLFGVVASRGRCGGMVFAALDAFLADRALPPEALAPSLPEHGSAIGRAIWERQVESVAMRLGANLWQFARFTYLPTAAPLGIAPATRRELLPLFDALRAGVPAPLGLVSVVSSKRLVANHQVLAYAAEFGEDSARISVYDPNHPGRDDVVLEVPLDPDRRVIERIGTRTKQWRGFFIERYSPRRTD